MVLVRSPMAFISVCESDSCMSVLFQRQVQRLAENSIYPGVNWILSSIKVSEPFSCICSGSFLSISIIVCVFLSVIDVYVFNILEFV